MIKFHLRSISILSSGEVYNIVCTLFGGASRMNKYWQIKEKVLEACNIAVTFMIHHIDIADAEIPLQ